MNRSKTRGGWVPIDKRFKNLLPNEREYTYLEAMFSYSVDRDNKKIGSINGYAALWKWSRDKVRRFVRTIGIGTDYQTDGHKTGKRQSIRYVFNKLDDAENRSSHPPRHPQTDTTIDPDPKSLNPKKSLKNYKGAQNKFALYPVSFLNYLKEKGKDVDKEKVRTVAYYLDTYKEKRGDAHPYLKPHQWDEAMSGILSAYDPDAGRGTGLDYEAAHPAEVDRHKRGH